MASTAQLGHSNEDVREFPDADKKLDDHVTRAGYTYRSLGENVAAGQSTPKEVFEGWLGSLTHRKIIERKEFQSLGLGLAEHSTTKRLYWTQIFATPRTDGVGGDGK